MSSNGRTGDGGGGGSVLTRLDQHQSSQILSSNICLVLRRRAVTYTPRLVYFTVVQLHVPIWTFLCPFFLTQGTHNRRHLSAHR